jgi:glycosyltransferase involved in cell wall biosynthesis
MKIAMVSEHASPLAVLGGEDAGGQNVHVDALARALARRGHEVVVHTRRDAAHLPSRVRLAAGVTVQHVDAGPPRPLPKDDLLEHMPAFAEELSWSWRMDRPDVVHAHFWMSALASLEAAPAAGVPVAVTFHALGSVKRRHQGVADTSPAGRIDHERSVVATADHVVATCSDEVRELTALGLDPALASVVPCGVDLTHFTPRGVRATRGSQRHRLLVLGRLVPRKGVEDAVRALRLLADTELVVAGGPPAEQLASDPEAVRLRDLARQLGVADRVEFRGAVDRAKVPALVRSADVVVCVPWYEPFGIVPLEAMACGVPVVGSGVGGLLDTVVPGVTGELVEPRRPQQLASVLRDLLDDPLRREVMGRAGARRARDRYSWDGVAAAHEQVYAGLASPQVAMVVGS